MTYLVSFLIGIIWGVGAASAASDGLVRRPWGIIGVMVGAGVTSFGVAHYLFHSL